MTTTKLSFETGDIGLYGSNGPAERLGFTTGNKFVWDTGPTTLNVIDFDFGLGHVKADIFADFTFGVRFSAGFGSAGKVSSNYDVSVDVEYPNVVVGRAGETVAFDFTNVTVDAASSLSEGLGAPVQVNIPNEVSSTPTVGQDDIPAPDDPFEIPAGLKLELIVGAEFGLTNISYKAPLKAREDFDDVKLFPTLEEKAISIVNLDARSSSLTFELADDIELKLRVPTGAALNGQSETTVVSNKGFSPSPFAQIEGDLDKLLTDLLAKFPGKGTVISEFLKKFIFIQTENDLLDLSRNSVIDGVTDGFGDDDPLLVLELKLLDVSGFAGLHVTEEVTVNLGFDDDDGKASFQFGGSDFVEDEENTAEAITDVPRVKVVLRSDNGTPDDLTDDHVSTGFLGEVIEMAQPGADAEPGYVTVQAWYDVDKARVSHSVGLGGKFGTEITFLSGSITGQIGDLLGISFGPLIKAEVPEGGLEVDLFNFFTRRFELTGGTYDNLPDGQVDDNQLAHEDWAYAKGEYNQQTAEYKYYWTNVVPNNYDPTAADAEEVAIKFALQNAKWRQEVVDTFNFVLDAKGIAPEDHIFLNTVRTFVASSNGGFQMENTAVFWDNATDSFTNFAFLQKDANNVVVAAPQKEANETAGIKFFFSFEDAGSSSDYLYSSDLSESQRDFFLGLTERAKNGLAEIRDTAVQVGQSQFSSNLGINILGTDLDDLVIYTAAESSADGALYLDGGSEDIHDTFLANFNYSHTGEAVAWDMLQEQLLKADAELTTYSFGDAGDPDNSIAGQTLDFAASILEFRDPDLELDSAPISQVAVRDFERFDIRFGDERDEVRTGINLTEWFDLGDGADRLYISSDVIQDQYFGGGGDDILILERRDFIPVGFFDDDPENQEPEAEFASDRIFGGLGFDMVSISASDEIGAPPLGIPALSEEADREYGIAWKDMRTEESYFTAEDDRDTLLDGLTDLLSRLNPDDVDATNREADADSSHIRIALAGAKSSGALVFDDVEGINVKGSGSVADLAFYTGGLFYDGGTKTLADGETGQPADVFVADFSAYEIAKMRAFETGNGMADIAPAGLVFNGQKSALSWAGSEVRNFETWILRGTSKADVFKGSDATDWISGGDGNDSFSNGAGLDTLIGGAGDDRFVVRLDDVTDLRLTGGDETDHFLSGVARRDNDVLTLTFSTEEESQSRYFTSSSFVDLTPDSTEEEAREAIEGRKMAQTIQVITGSEFVIAQGIEHTNLIGSAQFDDVLLYDGGTYYAGFERENDGDLFVADFSGDATPLNILIEDDETGFSAPLANGVILDGIDRMIGTLGDGADVFRGGRLTDIVDGGKGNDAMTGEGGADTLRGGEDNDTFYYEGDDGLDRFEGGTGIDSLAISNVDEAGSAFSDGGIEISVFTANNPAVPAAMLTGGALTFSSGASEITSVLDLVGVEGLNWQLGFTGDAGNALSYSEFESVDIIGSDEHDDIVLAQGGTLYLGGNRPGDVDLFAGDFSGETADLTIRTEPAIATAERAPAFYDIGNGVNIGGFERLHVVTGSGDDLVTGGRFNDYFETGIGNDLIIGTLGNDTVFAGGGDDRLSYIGGFDFFDGGKDFDRIEIAAQELGYELARRDINGEVVGNQIAANGIRSASDYRDDLAAILTAGGTGPTIQTYAYGSIIHENVEFISATGANAGDVFISGTEGGVLSTDGGDDFLISIGGNDFLLGGPGSDAYIFAPEFGHDVIGNEFSGVSELHFFGTNVGDLTAAVDTTGAHLVLTKDADNSVTIFDYFATSIAPTHVTLFADDALDGVGIDVTGLVSTTSGAAIVGQQYFGSDDSDLLDDFTDGADFYYGFQGDDLFVGNPGRDLYDGSIGDDYVSYENNLEGVQINLSNAVAAKGGDAEGDQFVSIEGIYASDFDDAVTGGSGENALYGFEGNDTLNGGAGDDRILGGKDADSLIGGAGDDQLYGGLGDDRLEGTTADMAGNDTLDGGDGADLLTDIIGDNVFVGGAGNDTAFGGSGNDVYYFEGRGDRSAFDFEDGIEEERTGGFDFFDGDAERDGVSFERFGAAVQAFMSLGSAETSDLDEITIPFGLRTLMSFSNVEDLTGSDFADILSGDDAANVISGGNGADMIIGLAGNDTLIGGDGGDTVNYFAEDGTSGVTVTLAETAIRSEDGSPVFGIATDSFGATDQLVSIEAVIGTALSDRITGGDGNDTITGMNGADTLDGGAGRDLLDYSAEGGPNGVYVDALYDNATDSLGDFDSIFNFEVFRLTDFNDTIYVDLPDQTAEVYALGGDDTIFGSKIEDFTYGGLGNDIAQLDTGNDYYFYEGGLDTLDGGGDFDLLDLDGFGAAVTVDLALNEVRAAATGAQLLEVSATEAVIGSDEADTMLGDAQDNRFEGGADDDVIDGRAGNDTLIGGEGNDTIDGGIGDDQITGGRGSDLARGGVGDDIFFYPGNRTGSLIGEVILDGQDEFFGGADTDTASMSQFGSPVWFDGSGIRDELGAKIVNLYEVEILIGSDFDDRFTGRWQFTDFERLEGLDGQDLFHGYLAGTIIDGGLDADWLTYENIFNGDLGVTVDLTLGQAHQGDATDILRSIENVTGSFFNDTLIGDGFDNIFQGSGGADFFDGRGGSDTVSFALEGGFQAQREGVIANLQSTGVQRFDAPFGLDSGVGIENVIGTEDGDILLGNLADNRLEGLDGDDTLIGANGDDTLIDGGGDDIANGDIGDDRVFHTGGTLEADGGADTDTLDLSELGYAVAAEMSPSGGSVTTNFTEAWNSGEATTEVVTFTKFENLTGTAFADHLTGDASGNLIEGLDGADILFGFDGADTLDGGNGFDIAGYGGETGNDGIVLSLQIGRAVDTHGADDVLIGIEGIRGSQNADQIDGDGANNIVTGHAGDDTLIGREGTDTLDYSVETGSSGITVDLALGTANDTHRNTDVISGFERVVGTGQADEISGNALNTEILGGAGSDRLWGRGGSNTLTGGADADVFVHGDGDGTLFVTDFEVGVDVLDLSQHLRRLADRALSEMTETRAGNLAISVDGSGVIVLEGVTLEGFDAGRVILSDLALPVLTALDNGSQVNGSDAAERLVGQGGDDTLRAGGGNDVVDGGDGNDLLDGGAGRNKVTYARVKDSGVEINLLQGYAEETLFRDELIGFSEAEGSQNADTLIGGNSGELLEGLDGDDYFEPGSGQDVMTLGAGEDTLAGTVLELDGDRVTDFEAGDTIEIRGGTFDIGSVRVSSGSALFEFDQDQDGFFESRLTLEGDFDSEIFEVVTIDDVSAIRIAASGTTLLTQSAERFITNDPTSNRVFGFESDDFVLTSGGADLLSGAAGSDVLLGGEGADILRGGRDNDAMTGGAGADVFVFDSSEFVGFTVDTITDFTPGEDRLSFTGFGDAVSLLDGALEILDATLISAGGSGFVRLEGVRAADLTLADIETPDAIGTPEFLQIIRYSTLSLASDRFITSDGGPNLVEADGGDDFVLTSDGNDEIFGGTGSDVAFGGAGNDTLSGGQGNDFLSGGTGEDVFLFKPNNETGFTVDTIEDFEIGIDLVRLDGASELPNIISLGGKASAQIGPTHFLNFESLTAGEIEANAAIVFDLG